MYDCCCKKTGLDFLPSNEYLIKAAKTIPIAMKIDLIAELACN
jgi:hypothetical protein